MAKILFPMVVWLASGSVFAQQPGYFPTLGKKEGSAIANALTCWTAPVYRIVEEAKGISTAGDVINPLSRGLPMGIADTVYSATRVPFQIVEGLLNRPYTYQDYMYWNRR